MPTTYSKVPDTLPNAPAAAVDVMSFVIVSLVEPQELGLGAGSPPSEQLIALKSAAKLYGQASAKPSSPATVWRGLALARSLVWRDYHTNESGKAHGKPVTLASTRSATRRGRQRRSTSSELKIIKLFLKK